jgi:hypothetical protein
MVEVAQGRGTLVVADTGSEKQNNDQQRAKHLDLGTPMGSATVGAA